VSTYFFATNQILRVMGFTTSASGFGARATLKIDSRQRGPRIVVLFTPYGNSWALPTGPDQGLRKRKNWAGLVVVTETLKTAPLVVTALVTSLQRMGGAEAGRVKKPPARSASSATKSGATMRWFGRSCRAATRLYDCLRCFA